MVGNTGDGKVNREQVLGAVNEFCRSSNGYIEEEGENKWAIIREDKPIIHCGLEKGKFVCSDSDIGFVLLEIAKGIQEEENRKVERDQDLEQIKKTKTRAKQEIVKPQVTNVILEPVIDNKDLTLENIKQYICPLATDEEAFMFLKLCQARRLNPFVKEAYCIKYSKDQPASFVVGKDAFTRRAEEHPQFDGFEAGIIISTPQKENVNYLISSAFEERGGTFYSEGKNCSADGPKCTVRIGANHSNPPYL